MEKTEAGRLPQHVAIILDGNGRWAAANGKRRSQGHRAGADNVETIGDAMIERGIPYLTVYAFSTENWNRSQEEVSYLMGLMKQYLIRNKKDALRKGIRIRVLGDRCRLSPELQRLIADMEEATADMKNLSLQFAINYGGRDDILHACNRLISSGAREVTAEQFEEALYTHGAPDPDLLIRTGGDYRISNFLLWQIAYAELYFTDTLWPDFRPEDLDAAIADFRLRKRRYGGV